MRIYVVGTSGSGKSTLAKRIAAGYKLDHLELDSLYHQADWTRLPDVDFQQRVKAFTQRANWVIDGNYSQVRPIILSRCTHVIILDYSRSVIMWRVIRRTLGRMLLRKTLWNGNRESLKYLFTLNKDENIVLWAWSTFASRRAGFDQLAKQLPENIELIRLSKPNQAKPLIDQLRLTKAK